MTRRKSEPRIYKVIFANHGQIFEIYASHVGQSHLLGFVEVEQLLFGERSQIIVDASEEKLKNEFAGVKRVFIPMHAVVRIDEVEKPGSSRISSPVGGASDVKVLPMPIGKPSGQPPSR
jgi:hypothetical protein